MSNPSLAVAKPRRNAELLLLILALAVGIGANFIVSFEPGQPLAGEFYSQAIVFALMTLGLHIVLRYRAQYADPVILPTVVALNGLGLAMIHRIDLELSPENQVGNRQLLWTILGMAFCGAVLWAVKDHRVLRRFTYISLVVSGVLLALPLLPFIGMEINGARIWINLGFATFQPGEIAKITLAIFFAGYLSMNRDLILLAGKKVGPIQFPRFRDLAPMIVAWLASIGILVFQTDLGSAILFFGLFVVMIYVATGRLSWILIGLVLVAAGGFFAYRTFSHVAARIDTWLNAFDPEVYDALGGSRQVVQGLFGMADGSLFGRGLGGGSPTTTYFANSDMIIASFGEELGMIGLYAILLLFLILVSRGVRAALGTRDGFGKLLAVGLSLSIALQVFVVVGGVTRLIPLTGLTTPFMAAGGSSLLANWIIVALLLRISDNARRPSPAQQAPQEPFPQTGDPAGMPPSGTPEATDVIRPEGARA
ncbi:FtsW/RodA/SpoVE family cell cycle protein [Haematomicrobium sanguinis]|uniref:FtsW/RodA/SpoVE family cell cycle protein n=1 Tax=Haematomicrobium sanguinis TaxID=479106 RepID=UPI0009497298|nr:FtsW/RodA/SpoVE family cell cycle protein [Haematomicrobium sanguinis]